MRKKQRERERKGIRAHANAGYKQNCCRPFAIIDRSLRIINFEIEIIRLRIRFKYRTGSEILSLKKLSSSRNGEKFEEMNFYENGIYIHMCVYI